MRKGFTLVEFLVTMIIVLLTLGGAYVAFVNLLGGFKSESKAIETQIETAVGLELLRLDIEHSGYGIGEDQPYLPVELASVATGDALYPVKDEFRIKSVLNNTNQGTIGWALVDCTAGFNKSAGDNIANNTPVVYLGAGSRTYVADSVFGTCPGGGFYIAVPYDTSVTTGCGTGGTAGQYCNEIKYVLSDTQNLGTCHPNTRNLLRKVGDGAGTPLFNCVAGWKVTFDVDRDKDGLVEVYDGTFNDTASQNDLDLNDDSVVTAEEVRGALKKVNVYIVVQEGRLEPGHTFRNVVACPAALPPTMSGDCIQVDTGAGTIHFELPVNYQSYRWKVVRLFVKPMNL